MHGFALLTLALGVGAIEVVKDVEAIRLTKDVEVSATRSFAMPLQIDPGQAAQTKRVRLFVSDDRGRSWKHRADYEPTAEKVTFFAPRDGLYWFALQVVGKDGSLDPAAEDDLAPVMKVYVNSRRRALKVQKSGAELQQEVDELRKEVESLRKRIKDLEAERK